MWTHWEWTHGIGGSDLHPVAHHHQATWIAETLPDTVTKRFERSEFASGRFVVVAYQLHRRRCYVKSQGQLQVRQHSKFASRTGCSLQAPPRTETDVSRRPDRQRHQSLTPTSSHSLTHLPLVAELEAHHLLPLSDLRRTARHALGPPSLHQAAQLHRRRRRKCTAFRSRQLRLQ